MGEEEEGKEHSQRIVVVVVDKEEAAAQTDREAEARHTGQMVDNGRVQEEREVVGGHPGEAAAAGNIGNSWGSSLLAGEGSHSEVEDMKDMKAGGRGTEEHGVDPGAERSE